jgi:hypothetical protein
MFGVLSGDAAREHERGGTKCLVKRGNGDTRTTLITNLDDLFSAAAADWIWTPPPPVEGGGHAPLKVASRTISVQFYLVDLLKGDSFLSGTLVYTPATTLKAGGLSHRIPAFFSGGTTDGSEISLTIVAVEAGYSVNVENAPGLGAMPIEVPTPGGAEGTVDDPQTNIGVSLGVYAGLSIFGYSFVATLVRAK